MTDKQTLEGKVRHYEQIFRDMRGRTFFCEDEEGFLRRWYPPAPILTKEDQ